MLPTIVSSKARCKVKHSCSFIFSNKSDEGLIAGSAGTAARLANKRRAIADFRGAARGGFTSVNDMSGVDVCSCDSCCSADSQCVEFDSPVRRRKIRCSKGDIGCAVQCDVGRSMLRGARENV